MTLLDAGQAEEASTLLEQAASSPLGDDAYILTGLARARLDSGHAALAVETLDGLFARHPDVRRKPEQTLLYAQALATAQAPVPAPHSSAPWNAETMRPLAASTPNG